MSAQEQDRALIPGRPGLGMQLFFRLAGNIRHGSLEVRLPGKSGRLFVGPEAGPAGVLEVHDPAFIRRVLSRGDLGFAEAYMDGQWSSPDLSELLGCLDRNLEHFRAMGRGRGLIRWLQALRQRLVLRNHRRGSRRNIAYHYDLGNDFYRLWLDAGMTYSCARFQGEAQFLDQSLEQVQDAKYDRLIGLAKIGPEDHVLEIGCGWGGFALRAAQTTGCRVTAVTISREQHDWARRRVRDAGLEDRVEIRLQDYRDVREVFDRVVSIEMFEAVGEAYWPLFFRSLKQRLRPGGLAALQIITIDDRHFERYRRDVDFIRRYIFPGGVLPSPTRLDALLEQAGLVTCLREYRGSDYARTLSIWAKRFHAVEPQILAQGFDHRFLRMWHYYLAYCEAGFHSGRINLMQTVLSRD